MSSLIPKTQIENQLFEKIFANEKIANFIGSLDRFFIKLPHLPKNIRVFINKIIPFIVLIFGIIGLIATVTTGFFLLLAILALDGNIMLELISSFALILIDTMFLLKAFKPLKQGNAVGWIYLFWAEIMEIINFIIRVVNAQTNIWMGIATILLSFYLLFEIGQFYVYKKTNNNV